MSNDTYAPWRRLSKWVFDIYVINMYCYKSIHIIEVGWLTWCDFVKRYGVSAFMLYNQKILRCSVKTVYKVDHKWHLTFDLVNLKTPGLVLAKANQHVK